MLSPKIQQKSKPKRCYHIIKIAFTQKKLKYKSMKTQTSLVSDYKSSLERMKDLELRFCQNHPLHVLFWKKWISLHFQYLEVLEQDDDTASRSEVFLKRRGNMISSLEIIIKNHKESKMLQQIFVELISTHDQGYLLCMDEIKKKCQEDLSFFYRNQKVSKAYLKTEGSF